MTYRTWSLLLIAIVALGCGPDEDAADPGDTDDDDDDSDPGGEDGWPEVDLQPAEWTFDDAPLGCEQTVDVTIGNLGDGPLTLSDCVLDSTSEELSLVSIPVGGLVLQPGSTATVLIHYIPLDEETDTAVLHVYTDDPARPDATSALTGWGRLAAPVVESFYGDGSVATDILWVVDDSASMADDQPWLGSNFDAFANQLIAEGLDFHLAVITTRDAAFRGGTPVMTPGTLDLTDTFADAAGVGTDGSGPGEGLLTTLNALTPPNTDPGGPNEDFLRHEAALHVVFVSDADDESPGGTIDYASPLAELKHDGGSLFLHGVVAQPAPRYEDAVSMTHGVLAELTDPAWFDQLAKVSWSDAAPRDTFVLSEVPVAGTLEVTVNDALVTDGWHHDADLNAVVFTADPLPDHDDIVTVKYTPVEDC